MCFLHGLGHLLNVIKWLINFSQFEINREGEKSFTVGYNVIKNDKKSRINSCKLRYGPLAADPTISNVTMWDHNLVCIIKDVSLLCNFLK